MGVPQARHRVFFVAVRNDIDFDLERLDMYFNYEPVLYREVKSGQHEELFIEMAKIAKLSIRKEKSLCDTMLRLKGKETYFSEKLIYEDEVCNTITAGGGELCKMDYDAWVARRGRARARKDERKQREHLSNVL